MQTLGTQRIETKRLILRRFTMKDVLPMYHNWASDPEVTKYLMWPAHSSPRVTETVLREWIENYEQDDFYQWAIVLKEKEKSLSAASASFRRMQKRAKHRLATVLVRNGGTKVLCPKRWKR